MQSFGTDNPAGPVQAAVTFLRLEALVERYDVALQASHIAYTQVGSIKMMCRFIQCAKSHLRRLVAV